ncbi:MAG: tetratricopeptide repeat protein, partial [Candidatus Hydrogenedentota bacterium]
TWLVQDAGGTMKSASVLPWADRFANAAVAYAAYITKAIYPFELAVLYPHRVGAIPMSIVALSASMIVIVSTASVLLLRRAPWFAVGWFWYFVALVPVIGLIQVGDQAIADRYTYIPLIGLFIAVVWGLHRLLSMPIVQEPALNKGELGSIGVRVFVIALLVLLTVQARVQVGYWRDSITLFERCIEVTKTNGPAHNNLGRAYHDGGDLEKARIHYQQALVDSPGLVIALNNLGLLELAQGNTDEALRLLEQVATLQPRDHRPQLNLGIVNAMRGQDEAAERWFREALDIAPDFPATRYSYGVFLLERGRATEAILQFEHALKVQPDHADTLAALERAKTAAETH